MSKKKPLSFENRILFIVRSFEEYGSYKRDINKAVNLLHKYHPDVSLNECDIQFNNYLKAFRDAIDFVDSHIDYYRDEYKNRNSGV